MNKHMPIAPVASIEGRVLSKALKPIASIVRGHSTYPILATVRLTLNKAGLRITSTNLDIEISTTLDVIQGDGEFDICVGADVLASIARAAGPSVIAFRLNDKIEVNHKGKETTVSVLSVSVDNGSAEYEIENLLEPTGFPALPGERGPMLETFTNGMLASALRRCESFISNEETRYYLNGVCWVQNDKGREFVATDGHRMVRYRYSGEAGGSVNRIIPHKTVVLLTRFFAGADITVHAVGETKLDFLADGFFIRSKLIEGTYPDYNRVIPTVEPASHHIAFSKAGLSHALRLASVIPGRVGYGRAIHVHQRDGMLCLKLNSADTGSAVAHTSFPWPEGAPDFGLNAKYLSDNLATCEGDAEFVFKDASSPILILDSDQTMTRVQMPMRV